MVVPRSHGQAERPLSRGQGADYLPPPRQGVETPIMLAGQARDLGQGRRCGAIRRLGGIVRQAIGNSPQVAALVFDAGRGSADLAAEHRRSVRQNLALVLDDLPIPGLGLAALGNKDGLVGQGPGAAGQAIARRGLDARQGLALGLLRGRHLAFRAHQAAAAGPLAAAVGGQVHSRGGQGLAEKNPWGGAYGATLRLDLQHHPGAGGWLG